VAVIGGEKNNHKGMANSNCPSGVGDLRKPPH